MCARTCGRVRVCMCAREEERARTRACARARGCDVGYIGVCVLRHILLGGGAPKLGEFWRCGWGVGRKCLCTARKGRFPGLWEGVTWNCALNRKRPLKSAPTASEGYPLKNPAILGRLVCSIFSIGGRFGPLQWRFCEGGLKAWAENGAERPSTRVFPDFYQGLGLWEGCRILEGLEGP